MSKAFLSRILLTSFSRVVSCRRNNLTTFCSIQGACSGRNNNKLNQINERSLGRAQYSTGASLVINKDDEERIINLYKDLATYDEEQVLELMTYKGKLELDATHLAICMKRLYASYVESDRKKDFVEGIRTDPRFLKLMNRLVVSARHLTAPVICDMVNFSQALGCPLPHFYGLLKLTTNVVGDVAMDKLAELSGVVLDAVNDMEERIKRGALAEQDIEWLPLLANQMELLMKCISILVESKKHQTKILDVKSEVDLLLTFSTEIDVITSLLKRMSKNAKEFWKSPEELIRAISAMLLCLSPLQSTSSLSSQSESWASHRINRFKNLLVNVDETASDGLLKDIKVEDKYDELVKGFQANLMRQEENKSLEVKEGRKNHCVQLLVDSINETLESYYMIEEPLSVSKQTIKLLLDACTKHLSVDEIPYFSRKCIELAQLASETIQYDLDCEDRRELWSIQEQLEVLSGFGEMECYQAALSATVARNAKEISGDDEEEAKMVLSPKLNLLTDDQLLGLLDATSALDLYEQNSSESGSQVGPGGFLLKVVLDHVEGNQEKFFSSGNSLDVRMRMASQMLANGRRVETLDSILKDLDSNLEQICSNERLLNETKMFIHLVKDASTTTTTDYSKEIHTRLFDEMKKLSDTTCKPVENVMNLLWPGMVTNSSSPFCGYLIDLPNSHCVSETKRVVLNFHSKGCFWENTTQLKPLWYHVEKSFQDRGFHVVPLDVRRALNMSDMKAFLKYRVESAHQFQDLLNIV